jgi:hypothetical protein
MPHPEEIVSDVALPEYLNEAIVSVTRVMAHVVSTQHPFDEGSRTCALRDLDEAVANIECARVALKRRALARVAGAGSPH